MKVKKITQCEIYHLVLLAQELKGHILEITVHPDLICMVALPEMLSEFTELLKLHKKKEIVLQCSYDTTFNLGDFYLSVLVFCHPLLKNNPVFPLAFVIHKRKFQKLHERFLDCLATQIPVLRTENIPIVLDRERGIRNAFEKVFPNVTILHCWNHIKQYLKFWLSKHGAGSIDRAFYMDNLNKILQSESVDAFNLNINKYMSKWTEAVVEYFENELKNDILNYAAPWVIRPFGIFKENSGITNNCSESLNAVLKRLHHHKEVTPDFMSLSLFYLQNYCHLEIQRGYGGIGINPIKQEFIEFKRARSSIVTPYFICKPEDIIDNVKCKLSSVTSNNGLSKAEGDPISAPKHGTSMRDTLKYLDSYEKTVPQVL